MNSEMDAIINSHVKLMMEPELAKTVYAIPEMWRRMFEQALVVAYWVGHQEANRERLAALDEIAKEGGH